MTYFSIDQSTCLKIVSARKIIKWRKKFGFVKKSKKKIFGSLESRNFFLNFDLSFMKFGSRETYITLKNIYEWKRLWWKRYLLFTPIFPSLNLFPNGKSVTTESIDLSRKGKLVESIVAKSIFRGERFFAAPISPSSRMFNSHLRIAAPKISVPRKKARLPAHIAP